MYPTRQQARLLQPGAVLQHHRSADPGAAGETLHASHQLYQQFQCSDVNSSTMKRVQVTHLSESSGVCGSPAVDLCAASRCPKHYCPWQEFTAAGWTDAGSLLSTEAIFYCLNDVLRSSPATKAEEAAGAQVCGAGGAAVRMMMMMVRRRRWSESWMELLACHQRLNNPLQRAQTPPPPQVLRSFYDFVFNNNKKRKSCHVKHLKCYTRCGKIGSATILSVFLYKKGNFARRQKKENDRKIIKEQVCGPS